MYRLSDSHRNPPRLMLARTALACVAVFAASCGSASRHPLAQLATAYETQRTVELRIPGAAFSPVVAQRGEGSAVPVLLEARAAVARGLAQQPGDAALLRAQGRAALLEWRFDQAIATLQAVSGAESPELLIDLATAYFERAEVNGQPVDYTRAVELLSQALQARPGDPAAHYNRGVVLARLLLYDAAIADFEACRQAEPDAQWRADTERRLGEARRQRARLVETPAGTTAESELEAAQANALAGNAARLAAEHGDLWLQEAAAAAPAHPEAVQALTAIARVRQSLQLDRYQALAASFQSLRRMRLPDALSVWRDFEILYRHSHGLAGACEAAPLLARARARRYRWFEVQALLEDSTCQVNAKRLDLADRSTLAALAAAEAARYRAARSRAQGFHSSHAVNEGRYREAFQLDAANLRELLAGGGPPGRAAQVYGNMMLASERLERWHTAIAAAEMMALFSQAAGWELPVAAAKARRAQYAARVDDPRTAALLAEAQAAAAGLPSASDAALYQSLTQIALLRASGDAAGLSRLAGQLGASDNPFVQLQWWCARGAVARRAGDWHAVEQAGAGVLATAFSSKANNARAWRRELGEGARLRTEARLARQDWPGALKQWREYLAAQARLLGGAAAPAGAPAPALRTAVITVAALDDRLAVWTSQDQVRFRWAAEPRALLGELRRLRWLCAQPGIPAASVEAAATVLRRALLADLAGTPERIVFELEGEWANLPVLLLAERGQEAWVAPFGSAELAWRLPQAALAVHADRTDARWSLPALPQLTSETEALAATFPRFTRIGSGDATVARLRAASARPDLLHFAGHAIRWRGELALVTAPDPAGTTDAERFGLWDGRPAAQETPRCRLAVFSACSTADYVDNDTVAPGQLAEGALARGAQHAVASLWNVDSQATARLMQEFYRALGTGETPAAALTRAAQRVRSTPGFEHPYYWAAFSVYQSNH